MAVVGVSVPRLDGLDKVRGATRYTADLELPGMLYARVLRSTYPHARLLRVDASRAARLPGVVVLTRDDLQGMDPCYGPVVRDQPIVALDKVRYVGDVVAAVAAEERDLAEEALDLVQVEYEPLPAVFDPLEAMRPGAPLIHERTLAMDAAILPGPIVHLERSGNTRSSHHVEQGDVEAGFAEADEIFEDTYTLPIIQHGHLEPHAALATWEASGKLVVYSSTQSPSQVRTQLAELFRLPESQVRIIVPCLGAGYGAKLYCKLEPLAAALARKARRPVQWALTREEVFLTIVRHAAVVRLKTGVKRDGTLLARQIEVVYDTGAYADCGPRVAKNSCHSSAGPYRIPHQRLTSYCVYTNKPPAGAFRGFGVPQVCWAYESQMDDIARRLGIDPLELRLKNLLREGDQFVTGEQLTSIGGSRCLEQVAETIGLRSAENESADLRLQSADWSQSALCNLKSQINRTQHSALVRGKGLACMIKSSTAATNSAASVRLNADGSAQLLTSAVEIGQGCGTTLAQIVAETLGLPLERVSVSLPDTDVTPYDFGTMSSRTIFSNGHAARQAALQVRTQVLDVAAQALEAAPQDLEIADGVVRVQGAPERCLTFAQVFQARFGTAVGSLFGNDDFQTRGGVDPETGKGKAAAFWFWSAAAAEVEVDTETGKVRVLKAAISVDAGKAINPRQCALQNEGSMLTALGSALFEELVFDNGQPINASFLDYMLPSLEDCPDSFQPWLVETPHPDGPFGAKGVGEAGLGPVAPAIGNAVANALGGVRIRDLPLRPDRVLSAECRVEGTQHPALGGLPP
ncbi:MAG: xanthine dehydrogenase family protein molybdopterin-binding subunit [Chloroflexi bacterium]|nr:xanthine dehydrogenase family protein molybdopterin-binding subunit [Chloroflexota bacterium]